MYSDTNHFVPNPNFNVPPLPAFGSVNMPNRFSTVDAMTQQTSKYNVTNA